MVRDPERGAHPVFDRVLRFRSDERLAPRVDHDHHVAGAFSLVLIGEEPVKASGRFPVNPTDLVAGDVLPDTPEVGARADLAGGDLTEPGTGAPRAEPCAPEGF